VPAVAIFSKCPSFCFCFCWHLVRGIYVRIHHRFTDKMVLCNLLNIYGHRNVPPCSIQKPRNLQAPKLSCPFFLGIL
jgi:hypothetical protein